MKGALAFVLAATLMSSCAASAARSDGLDTSTLPNEVRADYAVFAQRCSKCHSLARSLNSGITDQGYWQMYVARMRRQPASGISLEDTVPILRFLQYYSLDQQRRKAPATSSTSGSASPAVRPGAW
jgi:hypothetical protein